MKFIVDSLPYYGDSCSFASACLNRQDRDKCPRYWNKYFICSDDNPQECKYLIEFDKSVKEKTE